MDKKIITISLTLEAQAILRDYTTPRTQGEFIGQLLQDYHAKRTGALTAATIAAELRALADRLDK